jgi:hypothetical protein
MLVETQYLTNTKKLVVSYVDKSGDIKLKYYDWDNQWSIFTCDDTDVQKHPKFKSWDNKSVKQIEINHPDGYMIYDLDSCHRKKKMRYLNLTYLKYFIDIETENCRWISRSIRC